MALLVLAEFGNPAAMLDAARTLRKNGTTRLDSYTPYPVHGLEDALGLKPSVMPKIAAAGAVAGLSLAYGVMWFLNVVNYPLNVGGRPIHSAPLFIPITFEVGILLTAFSIFFGLLALWGLPRPHHPAFELESFRSASTHGFWLQAEVEGGSKDKIVSDLKGLGATLVETVEGDP